MIRAFLFCMFFSTAAFAQTATIEPWRVIDFIAGDFGGDYGDAKAFLLNDDEGRVDLYIFSERYIGFRSNKTPIHVLNITGMVRYPPTLALTEGGGFEISQHQASAGLWSWTGTNRIAEIRDEYFYVGYVLDFRDAQPPFTGVLCEYNYVEGWVEITTSDENEVVTGVEEHYFTPVALRPVTQQDGYAEPEMPETVLQLCKD